MTYNISFDIAALLFLFIIAIRFLTHKHFRTRANLTFLLLSVAIFLDIVLDIAGSILSSPPISLNISILYIINLMYYFVHQAVPALLVLFELSMVDKKVIKGIHYFLFMLPCFLLEAFLIVSVPYKFIFSIDPESGFAHGSLYPVIYAGYIIYFFINFIAIEKFKACLPEKVKRTYVFLMLITIVAVVLQYFFKDILLGGIGLVFSYTLVYFSIQRPEKYLDSVSGAFNRSAFTDYVKESFVKLHRHAVIIDIVGLRKVNAIYGFGEGNKVIRKIVKVISEPRKNIFRISDTKFAFFTKSLKESEYLFDYVRKMNVNRFLSEGESLLLSLNVCIIKNIKSFDNADRFVSIIDAVMAKSEMIKKSSNAFELLEDELEGYIKDVKIFENIKRDLNTGNGFFMKYQPIYDTENNVFSKAEALLRYQNDEVGYVSSGQFVPELEKQSAGSDLDNLVIRLVFSDISSGKIDVSKLNSIHVNLSATSFMTNKITDVILKQKDRYHIDPKNIELEITETASAQLPDVACYNIKRLTDCGFHIALDDFGTGFSNFERINLLKFSTIKLDRCLLFGEKSIYENIVKTFNNLGYTIIAEGTESLSDVEFVKAAGVRYIQGFYYSKPLLPDDLREFLG